LIVNIADALSGSAGLAGIQWALLGREPRELLLNELGALLADPRLPITCDLHRAKYKPGRKLTAYYDLRLGESGAAQRTRPIAVTWEPPATIGQPAAPELEQLQELICERGLATPFRRLVGELPAWGMRVQIAPLDLRYPQLVRLSDPDHVPALIATAYAIGAHGPAPAPDSRYTITPIRYRPGQRHVLRYDALNDQQAARMTFAKLYTGDNGVRAFQVATSVANWLAESGRGMSALRPLAYIAEDGVILYPQVVGTPLSQQLRQPSPAMARHLRVIGTALQALHQAPSALAGELKVNSFAAEIKAIARAAEHIHPLLPAVGAQIDAILEQARVLHEELPNEPLTFAHGDLKADHVWVTADGLTLIDFDTCYLADPAIDLGKFLADLQWWYVADDQPGGAATCTQAQDEFLAGYAEGGTPPERMLRARLYEALVLVKMTVRRVRLFDPDWAARTTRLIAHADALLARLATTHGQATSART
jgi:Phosphotransferase enzyme family